LVKVGLTELTITVRTPGVTDETFAVRTSCGNDETVEAQPGLTSCVCTQRTWGLSKITNNASQSFRIPALSLPSRAVQGPGWSIRSIKGATAITRKEKGTLDHTKDDWIAGGCAGSSGLRSRW
jgi:hypothetical protein